MIRKHILRVFRMGAVLIRTILPSLTSTPSRAGVPIGGGGARCTEAHGKAAPPAVLVGVEVETVGVLTEDACGAFGVKGVEEGLMFGLGQRDARTKPIVGVGEVGLGGQVEGAGFHG